MIFGYAAYIPKNVQLEKRIMKMLMTARGKKSEPSQSVSITRITQQQNIMKFLPKPRMEKIAAFLMILKKPSSKVTMMV